MTATGQSVDSQLALLMRGVEYGDPNLRQTMEQELRERLAEGRPLRVYCGFDPTSTDLTLGNLVPMLKLRQFQQLGHEVTFLIGTMTATIGDPTGRSAARPMQTPEEVEQKAETWLGQAFRVLDPNKTIVRRNGDWLASLTLSEIVQLAANFTVSQFLAHETFRDRHEQNIPIHLHEFIYALMQGYDAFEMNTDIQVGGTDQLFNIMAGRTIQRANSQKPQIALCLPLLTGTDGRIKMSKSVGNYIGLDDAASDMFGKIMSIPDHLIPQYFTLLTQVPSEEVADMWARIEAHAINPMDLKKRLGREVVALLYDEAAAAAAQAEFERVFQRREDPAESAEDCPVALGPDGTAEVDITQLIVDTGLAPSRSEARRLLSQGAVSLDGAALSTPRVQLREGSILRVGRHRFLRITRA